MWLFFLKQVDLKLQIWPIIRSSNFTPGSISRKDESFNLKSYMHPDVYKSTIYNSQNTEIIQLSKTIGLRNIVYIYIYTHIQWNITQPKKWNIVICWNMDGPRGYYTQWSKLNRERHISYDINYLWNLNNDKSESIYKTETDPQT